jgi:hypothetical protein
VFSNRHFRLKLAGALLVIALMGVAAALRGDSINPALWRCVSEPERWRDRPLWLPFATIVSAREGEFEIESGEVRIRVGGQAPAKPGEAVSLRVIFRAEGPRLDLVRSRVLGPHYRLRWLVEAVSVVVALAVLANFSRHFLCRPQVLQVKAADR